MDTKYDLHQIRIMSKKSWMKWIQTFVHNITMLSKWNSLSLISNFVIKILQIKIPEKNSSTLINRLQWEIEIQSISNGVTSQLPRSMEIYNLGMNKF